MNEPRWVYYAVVYNHTENNYLRFLLTAPDLVTAEQTVLGTLPRGWRAQHTQRVCTTTDDPFLKEL